MDMQGVLNQGILQSIVDKSAQRYIGASSFMRSKKEEMKKKSEMESLVAKHRRDCD
jgi:hypothetical protein